MDFWGEPDVPMTRREWVEILSQARPETVAGLAAGVEAVVQVEVTRPPAQGLILATVEDSVQGNPFHPGEILASTCEVRVAGHLGFGMCLGGDTRHAKNAAVVDAALQAGLPLQGDLLEALAEERRWLECRRRAEREAVQATRVCFDTMDPERR
jgi:alpha-D-ribose 1-methylphosphonate 5-triphosphate synthase subunit PhnG